MPASMVTARPGLKSSEAGTKLMAQSSIVFFDLVNWSTRTKDRNTRAVVNKRVTATTIANLGMRADNSIIAFLYLFTSTLSADWKKLALRKCFEISRRRG